MPRIKSGLNVIPVIHRALVTPRPVAVVLVEFTATLSPIPENTVIQHIPDAVILTINTPDETISGASGPSGPFNPVFST